MAPVLLHMFTLDQADVTVICAAMDTGGELAAAVALQRRFPALAIARARSSARMTTGPWRRTRRAPSLPPSPMPPVPRPASGLAWAPLACPVWPARDRRTPIWAA